MFSNIKNSLKQGVGGLVHKNTESRVFDQTNFNLTVIKGNALSTPVIAKAVYTIPELAHLTVKLSCQWFFQPEGKNTMIEIKNYKESFFHTILDDIGGK
jgi:hypothetical protein